MSRPTPPIPSVIVKRGARGVFCAGDHVFPDMVEAMQERKRSGGVAIVGVTGVVLAVIVTDGGLFRARDMGPLTAWAASWAALRKEARATCVDPLTTDNESPACSAERRSSRAGSKRTTRRDAAPKRASARR